MPFMRSESCSFIWHPKVVTWNFMARFSHPRKLGQEARVTLHSLSRATP